MASFWGTASAFGTFTGVERICSVWPQVGGPSGSGQQGN